MPVSATHILQAAPLTLRSPSSLSLSPLIELIIVNHVDLLGCRDRSSLRFFFFFLICFFFFLLLLLLLFFFFFVFFVFFCCPLRPPLNSFVDLKSSRIRGPLPHWWLDLAKHLCNSPLFVTLGHLHSLLGRPDQRLCIEIASSPTPPSSTIIIYCITFNHLALLPVLIWLHDTFDSLSH